MHPSLPSLLPVSIHLTGPDLYKGIARCAVQLSLPPGPFQGSSGLKHPSVLRYFLWPNACPSVSGRLFWGTELGKELLGHVVTLNLLRSWQAVFQGGCTTVLATATDEGSHFTPLPALVPVHPLVGVTWHLMVRFLSE